MGNRPGRKFGNGTLDQSKTQGDSLLDRRLILRIGQLTERAYRCVLARIDSMHSNIAAHWCAEDGWPTAEQWNRLHAIDTQDEQMLPDIIPVAGDAQLEFDLPLPGVLLLRLLPK